MTDERANVWTGCNHTLSRTTDNKILVWGIIPSNLGLVNNTVLIFPQNLPSPSNHPWVTFACGERHVIGLTKGGEAFSWGNNGCGQLGVANYDTTQPLVSPSSRWKKFFCGRNYSIGLTTSGKAFVWGQNEFGQLGLGDVRYRATPHRLHSPSGSSWSTFACGWDHAIGLTVLGEAFAWGRNEDGRLGIGNTERQLSPYPLPSPSVSPWKSFWCGSTHSIGMTLTGEVFVWGHNSYGELGLGHQEPVYSPQLLPSPSSPWVSFSCGNHVTFGITANEVFCWGRGDYGVLGLGNSESFSSPQPFPPPTSFPWIQINCGGMYCVGVTTTGEMYVWGRNDTGRLFRHGKDMFSPRPLPFPSGHLRITAKREKSSNASSPSFSLLGALESECYSDAKISSRESVHAIHSPLIKLRCPILLTQTPVPLSERALSQLLCVLYGSSPDPSTPIPVLIEMYHYIVMYESRDLEMVVFYSLVSRMTDVKDLLVILRLSKELHLDELYSSAVSRIRFLSPVPSSEELLAMAIKEGVSVELGWNICLVHTDPTKAPKLEKKLPQGAKSFVASLWTLRQSGEGCDFVIVVRGTRIPVHRFVLSERNEYFRALLANKMKEEFANEVILEDTPLSVESMNKLLDYFYCGALSFMSITESLEILMSVEYFSLKESPLLAQCRKNVESSLNAENCLSVLYLAHKWSQDELKEKALEIAANNFGQLNMSVMESWEKPLVIELMIAVQDKLKSQ